MLAGALTRNILLSLAEAEFFRPRWSAEILDEFVRQFERRFSDPKGAARQRAMMERAFPEALVADYGGFIDARYTTNNISIHGDVAIHQFIGEWTVAMPDGETIHETSKGIHILERQADGRWVITMDVWNTDTRPGADTEEM